MDWTWRAWRPAATFVAIGLAMLLTYHVINGKHGLSVWQKQRNEDKQLKKEIDDLQQENSHLRQRIDKLKSDPEAIEHEAREKLHYAKPGEVIYTLPAKQQSTAQPAGTGK
jgi:cell division protein FtsB